MLHLFTRRVALSTHRATATYTRILPSSHSLRSRSIPGNGLTPSTVQVFVNSQRNASTEATAATDEAKSSAKSGTTGRKEPKKVAALKAKPEGQAAKKKEAKKAKQKQKAKEAKEPKRACITLYAPTGMAYLVTPVVRTSHQTPFENHVPNGVIRPGGKVAPLHRAL